MCFIEERFRDFYLADDTDMSAVYYAFKAYYGRYPWIATGTPEEIDAFVRDKIWPYPQCGDFLLQRYYNDGMVEILED